MDVIYWLIPSMIFVGVVLVALLVLSIRNGQYDDLEGEGLRVLFDENNSGSNIKKKYENKG